MTQKANGIEFRLVGSFVTKEGDVWTEQTILWECSECAALVADTGLDHHTYWHVDVREGLGRDERR